VIPLCFSLFALIFLPVIFTVLSEPLSQLDCLDCSRKKNMLAKANHNIFSDIACKEFEAKVEVDVAAEFSVKFPLYALFL